MLTLDLYSLLSIIYMFTLPLYFILCTGSGKTSVSQDKFLVQTYTFAADASLPDMGKLIEFWRALPEHDIKEHR